MFNFAEDCLCIGIMKGLAIINMAIANCMFFKGKLIHWNATIRFRFVSISAWWLVICPICCFAYNLSNRVLKFGIHIGLFQWNIFEKYIVDFFHLIIIDSIFYEVNAVISSLRSVYFDGIASLNSKTIVVWFINNKITCNHIFFLEIHRFLIFTIFYPNKVSFMYHIIDFVQW